MARKRPSWAKTNVSWETKKAIWVRWALGDKIKDTLDYLQLNADKYKDAPVDRNTVNKVREELNEMPTELVNQLITEAPEVRTFVVQQRPDFRTEIETTSKDYENTGKSRDGEIYNKSDQIINERYFNNILEFLRNTCIGKSHMRRSESFVQFFELEANKYINMGLKYSCFKLCTNLNELLDFWEEYSVEYLWYRRLIEAGKLEDKWHSFDVALEDKSDTDYLVYEPEELYLLLPNPSAYLAFEIRFPEPGFPLSDSSYPNWKQELDKIITNCDTSYSEYRASIRDLLYL